MRTLLDAHAPPVFGQSYRPCPSKSMPELLCCISWCCWRAGVCWTGQPGALSCWRSRERSSLCLRAGPLGHFQSAPGGLPRGAGGPAAGTPVPSPRGARLALPWPLWFASLHRDVSSPCRAAAASELLWIQISRTLCINGPEIKSTIPVSLMFFLNWANWVKTKAGDWKK